MEYFFKNDTARWFAVVNLYLHKEKLNVIYNLRLNRQATNLWAKGVHHLFCK